MWHRGRAAEAEERHWGAATARGGVGQGAVRGPLIASVGRSGSYRRVLARLLRRSGRPLAAARKAERILDTLATGEGLSPWEAGSLTRWGDARVPGCVKFELGGGYRLICRRRGATLVALFLGSHEGCHSWLRESRGLDEVSRAIEVPPTASGTSMEREDNQPPESPSPPADGAYTDRQLRAVFAGLCGA